MNRPLVSILVPCYNMEGRLQRALASVAAQTYRPLELVVVDDGSTDSTYATLERLAPALEAKGVSVTLKRKGNGGAASAINVALPLACGEYVMWMDADDVLLPTNVEEKVRALEGHPECGFALCEGVVVEEGDMSKPTRWLRRVSHEGEDTLFRDLVDGRNVVYGAGTVLARASELRAAIPSGRIFESPEGQNWQLMLPLAYTASCSYVRRPLFACVAHSDSHSRAERSAEDLVRRRRNFAELQVETIRAIPGMADDERRSWVGRALDNQGKAMLSVAMRSGDRGLAAQVRAEVAGWGVTLPPELRSMPAWIAGRAARKVASLPRMALRPEAEPPQLGAADRALLASLQTVSGCERAISSPRVSLLGEACCGCGACSATCPRRCIEMTTDALGFPRPEVDQAACVRCGACEETCPALSRRASDGVTWSGRAFATDVDLRARSSSGGVFGILARATLATGGFVYGAAFGDSPAEVLHVRVADEEGLSRLMGSKYVQSAIGREVYEGVAGDLRSGDPVLFSGTACQCAAVANYLEGRRVPRDGLLLVDVACHGVPSPALWGRWLRHVSDEAGADVVSVDFRSKRTGWSNFSVVYSGASGTMRQSVFSDDWYMRAFLQNASLRGSCLGCPSKGACGSDVTLGDFWGIYRLHPEEDWEQGVSCVIARTERGRSAIEGERLARLLELGDECYDDIVAGNPALVTSVSPFHELTGFVGMVVSGALIADIVRKWPFNKRLVVRFKGKAKQLLGLLEQGRSK